MSPLSLASITVNPAAYPTAADALLEVREEALPRWWRLRSPDRGSVEHREHSPRVPGELIVPTYVMEYMALMRKRTEVGE